MVGLVIVTHSAALAHGVAETCRMMAKDVRLAIAGGELLPSGVEVLVVPGTQLSAGGEVLGPFVDRSLVLPHAARPEPIDQGPVAVVRIGLFVHSLDNELHSSRIDLRDGMAGDFDAQRPAPAPHSANSASMRTMSHDEHFRPCPRGKPDLKLEVMTAVPPLLNRQSNAR